MFYAVMIPEQGFPAFICAAFVPWDGEEGNVYGDAFAAGFGGLMSGEVAVLSRPQLLARPDGRVLLDDWEAGTHHRAHAFHQALSGYLNALATVEDWKREPGEPSLRVVDAPDTP